MSSASYSVLIVSGWPGAHYISRISQIESLVGHPTLICGRTDCRPRRHGERIPILDPDYRCPSSQESVLAWGPRGPQLTNISEFILGGSRTIRDWEAACALAASAYELVLVPWASWEIHYALAFLAPARETLLALRDCLGNTDWMLAAECPPDQTSGWAAAPVISLNQIEGSLVDSMRSLVFLENGDRGSAIAGLLTEGSVPSVVFLDLEILGDVDPIREAQLITLIKDGVGPKVGRSSRVPYRIYSPKSRHAFVELTRLKKSDGIEQMWVFDGGEEYSLIKEALERCALDRHGPHDVIGPFNLIRFAEMVQWVYAVDWGAGQHAEYGAFCSRSKDMRRALLHGVGDSLAIWNHDIMMY